MGDICPNRECRAAIVSLDDVYKIGGHYWCFECDDEMVDQIVEEL